MKYRDFFIFVISIFVMVKERVVNSKCKLLYFGICLSLFGVFIRPILERVYQSCNIYNASLFLFCSFESINLFIFLSIYLPAIYLQICLYKVICPSFLKAVLSAETVPFIKTVYRQIQIQTKANFIGLCRYVLSSKTVELD